MNTRIKWWLYRAMEGAVLFAFAALFWWTVWWVTSHAPHFEGPIH